MVINTELKFNKYQMLDKHHYISQHKLIANMAVISYTFLAYICGIILLFASNLILNIIGVFFITHSLVFSAYLTHEFMHGTIFKSRRWNNLN